MGENTLVAFGAALAVIFAVGGSSPAHATPTTSNTTAIAAPTAGITVEGGGVITTPVYFEFSWSGGTLIVAGGIVDPGPGTPALTLVLYTAGAVPSEIAHSALSPIKDNGFQTDFIETNLAAGNYDAGFEGTPTSTSTGGFINFLDSNGALVNVDPPVGVPEPGSLALFASGLLGLGAMYRRSARRS